MKKLSREDFNLLHLMLFDSPSSGEHNCIRISRDTLFYVDKTLNDVEETAPLTASQSSDNDLRKVALENAIIFREDGIDEVIKAAEKMYQYLKGNQNGKV